jgi:hypothetical protein
VADLRLPILRIPNGPKIDTAGRLYTAKATRLFCSAISDRPVVLIGITPARDGRSQNAHALGGGRISIPNFFAIAIARGICCCCWGERADFFEESSKRQA